MEKGARRRRRGGRNDKLSELVGKNDDRRSRASLKYREQSPPPVAAVTISNSPAFHLFFIGEKFVDLAVRNARNTLEEARKWGREPRMAAAAVVPAEGLGETSGLRAVGGEGCCRWSGTNPTARASYFARNVHWPNLASCFSFSTLSPLRQL